MLPTILVRVMAEPEPHPPPPLDVPAVAKELGERFTAAGHELYLVGGSVRDMVLGRSAPDLDFTTDAHPTQTTQLLRGWAERQYLVGVRFGTVGALKDGQRLEITTFRQEVYAEEHRKPSVTFGKDLQTDLSRRDFTINAMAIALPDGGFVDPVRRDPPPGRPRPGHAARPRNVLLRRSAAHGARRAVRGPARRRPGAPGSSRRCARCASDCEIVSAERIRDELDKLLVSEHPAAGLQLLVESGVADLFLPELARCSWSRTRCTATRMCCTTRTRWSSGPSPIRRFAWRRCCTTSGKPATRQITPDGVQFHHHEMVGARMAETRMRELRYPNATIEDVRTLVELHLRFHGYGDGDGWTDAAVRRYVRDAGPLLDRLNQLTRADCTTRNEKKAARFARLQDELEERIARLAEQENLRGPASAARRRAGDGAPGDRTRPAGRSGPRAPHGAPHGARSDPRGGGVRAPRRLGRGAGARTVAPFRSPVDSASSGPCSAASPSPRSA